MVIVGELSLQCGYLLREGGFASLLFLYQICLNYIYVGTGVDPCIGTF